MGELTWRHRDSISQQTGLPRRGRCGGHGTTKKKWQTHVVNLLGSQVEAVVSNWLKRSVEQPQSGHGLPFPGGMEWQPGLLRRTHPPTYLPTSETFFSEKKEISHRGPKVEVDFRFTTFFLASDPPTPHPLASITVATKPWPDRSTPSAHQHPQSLALPCNYLKANHKKCPQHGP